MIGLILSDVLGDPLDIIASAPTVANQDSETLAKEIIAKYIGLSNIPENIQMVLENPVVTPPQKDVTNIIIGNNTVALTTAAKTSELLNLHPIILSNTISGEASDVGYCIGHTAEAMAYLFHNQGSDDAAARAYKERVTKAMKTLKIDDSKITELLNTLTNQEIQSRYDGMCILLGGETTVTVRGSGVGGRNQELVLSAAMKIDACSNNPHVKGKIAVLSAGTDGYDGPCDAAGAVANSSTVQNGCMCKLAAFEYLRQNNSYEYFKANGGGAYHIITGHTETNVMDLMVIVLVK